MKLFLFCFPHLQFNCQITLKHQQKSFAKIKKVDIYKTCSFLILVFSEFFQKIIASRWAPMLINL